MAKKDSSQSITIITVNERIKELNLEQLRMLVVLMASGHGFTEAYEVARTYGAQSAE